MRAQPRRTTGTNRMPGALEDANGVKLFLIPAWRIAWATGAAIGTLIIQLILQSAAANDPALNILQWLIPLGIIGALSYIYFARGRHLGKIERPQLDVFRNTAGASS